MLSAFEETGDIALRYGKQTPSSLQTQLALRATRHWTTPANSQFHFNAQLGWTCEHSDTPNKIESGFAGAPSTSPSPSPAP